MTFNSPEGYETLCAVLGEAVEQASRGKGKERHAEAGEPYEKQIICEVTRRVGLGYPLGQAVKKIYESQRLIPQLGVQELLGALNYVAAAVIVMQERMDEEGRKFREGFVNSKVEGCEELVQDVAGECRDCSGFRNGTVPEECEGCMKTVESDAPQTKEELMQRIMDANPAIYSGGAE